MLANRGRFFGATHVVVHFHGRNAKSVLWGDNEAELLAKADELNAGRTVDEQCTPVVLYAVQPISEPVETFTVNHDGKQNGEG